MIGGRRSFTDIPPNRFAGNVTGIYVAVLVGTETRRSARLTMAEGFNEFLSSIERRRETQQLKMSRRDGAKPCSSIEGNKFAKES